MAIEQSEVRARIRGLIPTTVDMVEFPESSLDFAIEAALIWHTRFFPRARLELGTGDGAESVFALPSDFLRIRKVEYEYGETPPEYLAATGWSVHLGTAGEEIVFESAPGSAEVFGIHYTGRWSLDAMGDDDRNPLAMLSCAYVSMRQAARMADYLEPSLEADVVNYDNKSNQWVRLKDHFISLYAMFYGLSADAVRKGMPPAAFGFGVVPEKHRFARWFWATE